MTAARTLGRPRVAAALAIALGVVALVAATVVGSGAVGLEGFVQPPPLLRAALVGGAVAVAVVLLGRSVARMGSSGAEDVPGLIRGVRLAFLAVAALAAAAGWALGHPLPLVVAAIIAGIDVVETSFLLLVVGRGRTEHG